MQKLDNIKRWLVSILSKHISKRLIKNTSRALSFEYNNISIIIGRYHKSRFIMTYLVSNEAEAFLKCFIIDIHKL